MADSRSLFSLAELRSLTRLASPTPSVHADALEALIDAVEAARAFRRKVVNGLLVEDAGERRRLDDALARFESREIVLDLDALPEGELERFRREIPRA